MMHGFTPRGWRRKISKIAILTTSAKYKDFPADADICLFKKHMKITIIAKII